MALGCGSLEAVVFDRGGAQPLFPLTGVVEGEWSRLLDDTSDAFVRLVVSPDCCENIDALRTWRHELALYRDGELAWGPGPITYISIVGDDVEVRARDISAWFDVRLHHSTQTLEGEPTSVAVDILADAMAPDDPGILDAIEVVSTSTDTVTVVLVTDSDYAGDALRELARAHLDFTVLGRSLLIGAPLEWGPTAALFDTDFRSAIPIEEIGDRVATRWVVEGESLDGVASITEDYYGLIERRVRERDFTDQSTLDAAAASRLAASYPAPLNIGDLNDATLSPDTLLGIDDLVPGALVQVVSRDACRDVRATLRLVELRVSYDSGDEAVNVTLAPVPVPVEG